MTYVTICDRQSVTTGWVTMFQLYWEYLKYAHALGWWDQKNKHLEALWLDSVCFKARFEDGWQPGNSEGTCSFEGGETAIRPSPRISSVPPKKTLYKNSVFACGFKWTQRSHFLLISLMLSIFCSITSFGTILGRSLLILNFIGPAGSARAYQFMPAQLRMDNLLCNPYLALLEYSLEGVAGKDLQLLP